MIAIPMLYLNKFLVAFFEMSLTLLDPSAVIFTNGTQKGAVRSKELGCVVRWEG